MDPPHDGVVSPNDGIVPLSSVQLANSMSIGVSDNRHPDLLGDEEYQIGEKIVVGIGVTQNHIRKRVFS